MSRYLYLAVLMCGCNYGCTTTTQVSPMALTNGQPLDDKQMLAMIKAEVLGLKEKPALNRLRAMGFSEGFVTSKSEERRRVWCMKEDPIGSLVVKKWNVILLVDGSGNVSAVEVSSGLIGP